MFLAPFSICCLFCHRADTINSRPGSNMISNYAALQAPLVDEVPHFQTPSISCYNSAMLCVCDLTTLPLHACGLVESDTILRL